MSARDAAVRALLVIHEQGGYSNIVLEELLSDCELNAADRGLASRLLYGVTERRLTLDYLLNHTASTPVKMMDPAVREILRVAVYQLVYMDKTPAFAVINEAVNQTKQFGYSRLSGFVNGVLRNIQRGCGKLLSDLPDTDKGLEIRYSIPRHWIRAWRDAYGKEVLEGLLSHLNDAPPAYIRVNTSKTAFADFCRLLDGRNVTYSAIPHLPNALRIDNPSALRELPAECGAHYYFQDLASQWCCSALGAQPGERIADLCAAPGGKTMTVAQYMNNDGYIVAGDIHGHKCRALEHRVHRFGFDIISVRQQDASSDPPSEWVGTMDRVVCDVPCSGLGVIRRKPEIRYKSPDDFADLPQLQYRILQQGARLVRNGGVLQYSTCTLRPQENQEIARRFLREHPEFVPAPLALEPCFAASGLPVSHEITLFPHIHGSDGFYVARFIKTT